MFSSNRYSSSSLNSLQLSVIFLVYVIAALIFGIAYRFAINPDGVAELRLAGYIAEGNFAQSVISSLSPLMTWLYAPFLFAGFSGLYAARIAIALCGAVLILSCWFISFRFNLSRNNRFAALLITALLISYWSIKNIGMDLLFAAMILFYLYLVTNEAILTSKKVSFLCGVIGGVSYLAHHYALPFFLAHFPLILFLRGFLYRNGSVLPLKRIFSSCLIGLAGFSIIAVAWISVVSVKYARITISNKGSMAHAVMGPKDADRRFPFFIGGLYKPKKDNAIHIFEDPSDVKFKLWSPFESSEYFKYQITIIKDNVVYMFNHFVDKSPFFTYAFICGILLFLPVAFLIKPPDIDSKFRYLWIIITFSIYSSGFLLITARAPRRFYALMILFLFLSLNFLNEFLNSITEIVSDKRKKLIYIYLLFVVVMGFALKPGIQLIESAKNILVSEQVNPYEEMANEINTINFSSPYAIIRSAQKPHTDLYIAYYLQKQLLGRPVAKEVEDISNELKTATAKSLLVFDNDETVNKLKNNKDFTHIASIEFKGTRKYAQTVNINIEEHEIITGWDKKVTIFTLN